MPKAYWVSSYRKIMDPDKLAAYAKLAPEAIKPFGGEYLVRGNPAVVYEVRDQGAGRSSPCFRAWSRPSPPMTARPTRRRCARWTAAPIGKFAS